MTEISSAKRVSSKQFEIRMGKCRGGSILFRNKCRCRDKPGFTLSDVCLISCQLLNFEFRGTFSMPLRDAPTFSLLQALPPHYELKTQLTRVVDEAQPSCHKKTLATMKVPSFPTCFIPLKKTFKWWGMYLVGEGGACNSYRGEGGQHQHPYLRSPQMTPCGQTG